MSLAYGNKLGRGDYSKTAGVNIGQILSIPMDDESDDLYHSSNFEILWLILEIISLTLFVLMREKGEMQENRVWMPGIYPQTNTKGKNKKSSKAEIKTKKKKSQNEMSMNASHC